MYLETGEDATHHHQSAVSNPTAAGSVNHQNLYMCSTISKPKKREGPFRPSSTKKMVQEEPGGGDIHFIFRFQ